MPRAFDPINNQGKQFPKSLEALRNATRGGAVADNDAVASGAAPVALDPVAYESKVVTSGTAGNEIVQLPSAATVGQRHLVTFDAEGNASDVIRINGDGSSSLQSGGAVGETPAAITNVDLDTPGKFALFEYQGGDVWNLLYTDGATS